MSTRTADERMHGKRPTSEALRARGRRLFRERVRGDSLLAHVFREMPRPLVEMLAMFAEAAFQLGYEAGWDESRNATDD